jgi:hypothetical protein
MHAFVISLHDGVVYNGLEQERQGVIVVVEEEGAVQVRHYGRHGRQVVLLIVLLEGGDG